MNTRIEVHDLGTPEFEQSTKDKKIIKIIYHDGDYLLVLSDGSVIVFFHSEHEAGLYWKSYDPNVRLSPAAGLCDG